MKQNAMVLVASVLILATSAEPTVAGGLTREEENTISAYAGVMPSVVTILVESVPGSNDGLDAPGGRNFSLGSGFAIEPGIVVTNFHVLENARMISVVRHDGSEAAGTIVGTAPGLDLAILKVAFSEMELPPAPVASAVDVQVGQKVLTVSSPLGLHHSATVGIVSSLHRELPGLDLGPSLIQFDAALNVGQSGGPLVDSQGRVIGVTTARIQGAEAIGFAIPVDIVAAILPDLKAMGHPFRPQLGISGTTVTPALAALFKLPVGYGVLVERTETDSVARKAGLTGGTRRISLGDRVYMLGGEIIIGVDDARIGSTGDLLRRLLVARPGDRLAFVVRDETGTRRVMIDVPQMRH